MKNLMTSTAVIFALSLPAVASDGYTSQTFMDNAQEAHSAADLRASDLIGMRIYTTETDVDAGFMVDTGTDWNDIGEVNDIILSRDGSTEAVLLDIGGFLGIGEKTVAVNMNQLRLVADSDDPGEYFIVFKSDREMLERAPEFDVDRIGAWMDAAVNDAEQATDATMEKAEEAFAWAAAPEITREGFEDYEREALTAEMLTGAPVYDTNDEWIGEVSKVVLDDNGQVKEAVLDVGGFLGIGEKEVATGLESLTIKRETEGESLRVYVDTTKEMLEAMPAHDEG